MKARHKASLLHFHLPVGGYVLSFAGINFLGHPDFRTIICLNEINGHSCGQKSSQTGIVLIWYPSKQSSAKARTRTIKLIRLLEVHVLPQFLLEGQHHTGEVARIPLSFEDSGTYLYPFDAVYIQMGYNCLVGKAVEVETVGYPVHTRLLHL